jgi:glutamyl-tRNA synthetase
MELKKLILRFALDNAVTHDGEAQPKSVLGKILAEEPALRNNLLEIQSMVNETVEDINKLSLTQQKNQLKQVGEVVKEVKEETKDLPSLDISGKGKVVMRFAPNPDGALHLGNTRIAVLNYAYIKKYKGQLILRFDDTDPKIKIPEKKFYAWIKQDLKWLGMKWSKEIIASKRLPIYYKYAEELIKKGKAYICTCDPEQWRKLRDKRQSCPCRKLVLKEQNKRWAKLRGQKPLYKEGEAVLRIKTDMELKNPAVRDWPAMRVVDNPKHPLVKAKLWPLYNFASAIDDHLTGITHILRGQEHSTNEAKQKYIYNYFGWNYPSTHIVGRFLMSDVVLSKSEIRKGIASKNYSGWDDPRLGTLRALKRRGFQTEAIENMIIDIGLKPNDITVSMENLSAYNRKIIDPIAKRYFFVKNPKKISLDKLPFKKITLEHHPTEKLGSRTINLSKTFYITSEDFDKCKGIEVRLKDLFNIKLSSKSKFTSKQVKNIPKIHWVTDKHINVRITMPEKTVKGYGEQVMKNLKPGEIIQMERFGFGRVESVGKNTISIIFTHE